MRWLRKPLLRHLAVLLAVLLPLKALAAVVIPITGLPEHHHAAQVHAVHAHCESMDESEGDAPSPLHEHACPHLGMASIPLAILSVAPPATRPSTPTFTARPLASVVLDVPHPPPTR